MTASSTTSNAFGIARVDASELTNLQWAVSKYQVELPAMVGVGAAAAAKAMKDSMQASFKRATTHSKPNTTATIMNKNLKPEFWGGWGFNTLASQGLINTKTLVESGALAQAVDDIDVSVTQHMGATYGVMAMSLPMAGSDCYLARQTRANPNYVYAWAHETGAGPSPKMYKFGVMAWGNDWSIPKRPWIEAGGRAGLIKAKAIMAKAAAAAQGDFEESVRTHAFKGLGLDFSLGITFWDVVSILLPPSKAYAVLGALDDYSSMMSGAFEFGSLNAWMSRYVAGGMGLTKNSYKRKIRRAIYS